MLNGYENLDQFRDVEEQDLDSLGIMESETRTRLLAAVTSILEYEQSCLSIVGQISETSIVNNTSSSSRDSGCFTDQKVANLVPEADDSNIDARQSSPSTDNSSGYQSRGNYAIPISGEVSSTLQEVPDTTLDSSSSTDETPMSRIKKYTAVNLNTSARVDNSKSNYNEPDSYRATLATVRPGTPELPDKVEAELRPKGEQSTAGTGERCSADTGISSQSDRSSATDGLQSVDDPS